MQPVNIPSFFPYFLPTFVQHIHQAMILEIYDYQRIQQLQEIMHLYLSMYVMVFVLILYIPPFSTNITPHPNLGQPNRKIAILARYHSELHKQVIHHLYPKLFHSLQSQHSQFFLFFLHNLFSQVRYLAMF